MKKITAIMITCIASMSFSTLNSVPKIVSININSEGKTIGFDSKGIPVKFCPGTGVPCTAYFVLDDEPITVTGQKTKGSNSIIFGSL